MPGRRVSGFAGAEVDPKGFMGIAGRAGFAPRAGAIPQEAGRDGWFVGSSGRVWRRRLSPVWVLGGRPVDHPDQWVCQENAEDAGTRTGAGRAAAARLLKPQESAMNDDLEKYLARRKRADKAFAKDFDAGYEEFKIGVMLRQAREQAGVTQEKLALITKTKKSAISRLENHAEDVRLSTVVRVARALGKTLRMELIEAKS